VADAAELRHEAVRLGANVAAVARPTGGERRHSTRGSHVRIRGRSALAVGTAQHQLVGDRHRGHDSHGQGADRARERAHDSCECEAMAMTVKESRGTRWHVRGLGGADLGLGLAQKTIACYERFAISSSTSCRSTTRVCGRVLTACDLKQI